MHWCFCDIFSCSLPCVDHRTLEVLESRTWCCFYSLDFAVNQSFRRRLFPQTLLLLFRVISISSNCLARLLNFSLFSLVFQFVFLIHYSSPTLDLLSQFDYLNVILILLFLWIILSSVALDILALAKISSNTTINASISSVWMNWRSILWSKKVAVKEWKKSNFSSDTNKIMKSALKRRDPRN